MANVVAKGGEREGNCIIEVASRSWCGWQRFDTQLWSKSNGWWRVDGEGRSQCFEYTTTGSIVDA